MSRYAILIPTRNRPQKVIELLKSITSSTIKPRQIIIVASGVDIAFQLDPFNSILPITYQHTEISGQINQKRLGITLLEAGIEWCLFMDDDLKLDSKAVEIAFNEIAKYEKKDLVGIGFSLPVTSRAFDSSKLTVRIGELFGVASKPIGCVLSNGHAVSYLQSEITIETEWLNGASMWRVDLLDSYGRDLPSTKYAACEDLIFSYPLRKYGTLLYVPTARMCFQDIEKTDFNDISVIKYASYWRYFFVKQNAELSLFKFAISEFGRTLFALRDSKIKSLDYSLKLMKHFSILLFRVTFRVDPRRTLNSI